MSGNAPPLLENATRDLAAFAAKLKFEDIPREAVERIKYCALDSIGCCLFGVTLPWTKHVQAMVQEEGAKAAASIFGGGGKRSLSCIRARSRRQWRWLSRKQPAARRDAT